MCLYWQYSSEKKKENKYAHDGIEPGPLAFDTTTSPLHHYATYTYSVFIIGYLYVMIVYNSSLDNAILTPLAITLMMSYPLLL